MRTRTIHRAIKYRLFPDEEQEIQINKTFGCVRKVYNMGLEMQVGLHASGSGMMSKTDMNNYCNRVWKAGFPFLREVDKFALTNSIYSLDAAYRNFFGGRAKFPRFKSKKDSRNSYTTNITNGNISVAGGKNGKGYVKLPKLGNVDARIHRSPPEGWNIISATVSVSASGKYFVSVHFSAQIGIPTVLLDEGNAIGLDYSSPDFYEDSNGHIPDVPHAYRKSERRLAKAQRKLSRMEHGSRNYLEQKKTVARIHEHVANQRKDFCHNIRKGGYDEEIQRVNAVKTSLMAKKAELEREGRIAAAFDRRMEEITRELEQTAGTITEFDEITVRQLVSNIKVVNKDTLLICFKDGTEITQTVENTGRASA